jgi:hypothetical protein
MMSSAGAESSSARGRDVFFFATTGTVPSYPKRASSSDQAGMLL